jgi:predicted ArsR family transcriptional regulator
LFDQRVLSVLSGGKPKVFLQLLGNVCFSRNKLKSHLERLTVQSLVVKEKALSNGRGGPKDTPISYRSE